MRKWKLKFISVALGIPLALAPLATEADTLGELEALMRHSFHAQSQRGASLLIDQVNAWSDESVSNKDALLAKYMRSHWRMWTQYHLLQKLQHQQSGEYVYTLLQLQRLRYALTDRTVASLKSSFDKLLDSDRNDRALRRQLAHLLAEQGGSEVVYPWLQTLGDAEALLIVGPSELLKIPPIDPSRWGSDGWLGRQNFDHYLFKDGGVFYRGHLIKEFDLLTVDLNQIYDGLNTSFSIPPSQFTHNGIVVFLEHNGRKIPVVFEIHAAGLRIVPLNRYLSPRFSRYAEILRRRDPLPDTLHRDLNSLVRRLLNDQMGYDFEARPIPEEGYDVMVRTGQTNVVCSSLVDLLNRTLNLPIVIPTSEVAMGAAHNMGAVGLHDLASRGRYLTPTDLKRAPGYKSVGIVDNGFVLNLIRELVQGGNEIPGTVGYYVNHSRLTPEKIEPWQRRMLFKSIRQLKNGLDSRGLARKLLLPIPQWLLGMSESAIPHASGTALATIIALNNAIKPAGYSVARAAPRDFPELSDLPSGEAAARCEAIFALASERVPFNLRDVQANEEVIRAIQGALEASRFTSAFTE